MNLSSNHIQQEANIIIMVSEAKVKQEPIVFINFGICPQLN